MSARLLLNIPESGELNRCTTDSMLFVAMAAVVNQERKPLD